ncbi:MAG: hypothetical protein ACJ77A_12455 [Actinomycetota bacterium]
MGPVGAAEGEGLVSVGEGEVVSLGAGAGLSAGEGESDGAGEGESLGAGDGVSLGAADGLSLGDGLGESVEDDELLGLANADTAPAGPAMIDAAMQTTRMKALAVFLMPNVVPARRARERPNKRPLPIESRAGVASPCAEPGAVPIPCSPSHEADE